jgi:hypothetical protein
LIVMSIADVNYFIKLILIVEGLVHWEDILFYLKLCWTALLIGIGYSKWCT